MKKIFVLILVFWMMSIAMVYAAPDYYYGDANVYTGSSANVPPNIMLLFDISKIMSYAGSALTYNPYPDGDDTQPPNYNPGYIDTYKNLGYETDFETGEIYYLSNGVPKPYNVTLAALETTNPVAYVSFLKYGSWSGTLSNKALLFITGDLGCLTYELSLLTSSVWSASTDYAINDTIDVDVDDDGVSDGRFVCVQAGTSGAGHPSWNLTGEITDNTVKWEAASSALAVAADTLKTIVDVLGDKVNLGISVLSDNNIGASILQPLVKLDTQAKIDDFKAELDFLSSLRISGNHWQVNEALWDVGAYLRDDLASAYSSKIDDDISLDPSLQDDVAGSPPSVEYWCQEQHIIVVTGGLGIPETISKTSGDVEDLVLFNSEDPPATDVHGSSVDVAKHLYDVPIFSVDDVEHPLHIKTHLIQMISLFLLPLKETADYGHGEYFHLDDASQLGIILGNLILGLLEVDSSFVAPVVPASPENRAYSGQRIYLGFFKPMNDEPWYGNLKKFGLNSYNQITAFNIDVDSDGEDDLATDIDGYFLVDSNGNPATRSFWDDTMMDGGLVDAGGVGALLKTRDAARDIYTYTYSDVDVPTETQRDLTDSSNSFSVDDNETPDDITDDVSNISSTDLGVADNAEAVKLINFIHGKDSYGSDPIAQRPWFMGDIVHSKPVVLNYQNYTFDLTNEADTDENKGYVFVGANDGMLHAFRDADGSEAWAFIPADLLSNLQYLSDTDYHYYFVDNSPVIYVYDADNDGNIETPENPGDDSADLGDMNTDKAILICGMRRGGGSSSITPDSQGSYFALDISNPESPTFLWEINSDTPGFEELGQTWSLPRLTKMRVGDATKVVAILGAGYDTVEDLRYGPKQMFPKGIISGTETSNASTGEGPDGSGAEDDAMPSTIQRGRGIYIIEVAMLDDGNPDTSNDFAISSSATLIRSFTPVGTLGDNTSVAFTYSVPSDPLVVDQDNNGYIDHIYIGDTGGQLWRFNVESSTASEWTATKIFTANSTSENGSDVGRKIFYKPTATINGYDTFIYFGTGDREHPSNTGVVDRFYVVRDRENDEANPWPMDESDLVSVTDYDDYDSTTWAQLNEPYTDDLTKFYYGWFIRLDDTPPSGEKVLATPKVFNGTVYFTTYQPATSANVDPCVGNLGPARLYAVKATTGEAVFNFSDYDPGNDSWNTLANGEELEARDRYIEPNDDGSGGIGDGISSEPLIMINNKGAVSIMVGRGGGFFNSGTVESIDPVFPVYWMKW